MSGKPSFTIIIANYNYERFVARAIDSALALRGCQPEIIVVDDGSHDGSRAVIDDYAGRITAIYQGNAGQRAANNAGFAVSTGDIVIFLDADDMLDETLAQEITAIWKPGISKVQVQMRRVDGAERSLGSTIPQFRVAPQPARIRQWLLASAEYPSPPGSGNAYARSFLERIFPLGEDRDSSTDTSCVAMAPLFGDVVTIAKPLVSYRIHGANDSNMLTRPDVFAREVSRAIVRLKAIQDACVMQGVTPPDADVLFRGKHLLQLRSASLRLSPERHPLAGDGRWRALCDSIATIVRRDFESFSRRILIAGWSLLTLLAPLPLSRKLIAWRFAGNS